MIYLMLNQQEGKTPSADMLRYTEEILLLLLDEESGGFAPNLPSRSLNVILASAVLMDLVYENRIDTDLEQLILVDPAPVSDDLLDPALDDIAKASEAHDTKYWILRTAERGDEILDKVLARLIRHGILVGDANESGAVFFSHAVTRARRYPVKDGKNIEDVRLRIMRLLFSDDVPDPFDLVIVSLANAGRVFDRLLSREERAEVQERIDLLVKMDLIGRTLGEVIESIKITGSPSRLSKNPPPDAPGLPIIGNALSMGGNIQTFMLENYRKLGPVFQARAFNRHYIILAGPEANTFIKTEDKRYFRGHELWRDFGAELGAANILAGLDGLDHVRMRKELGPAFSYRRIENHAEDLVRLTRRTIDELPMDSPVSARHAFSRIVTEQLGNVLGSGVSAREYLEDLPTFFNALLNTQFLGVWPRQVMLLPKIRRARRRIEELSAKMIAHHELKQRDEASIDYIDVVLNMHHNSPQLMPETDLMINTAGLFLVGMYTVPSASAFMFYALLKHPDLMQRMTAEADAFFAAGATMSGYGSQLDITRRIIMETLRMYPLTPALPRIVSNPFEFGGYTVPAGSNALLGISVTHQLPEFFPSPQRFDIDRYTEERAEHKQPGAYLPFGAGSHMCMGSRFAEAQMALVMATLLHEAEFVLSPGDYELKIKHFPFPRPADSFKFRMRCRRR